MVNMKLNTSKKGAVKTAFVVAIMFAAVPAFAQATGGGGGMCTMITWLRNIVGGAAVLAVMLLVINSFFGKSALIGEIIEKVLIGCIVIGAFGAILQSTGVTPPAC